MHAKSIHIRAHCVTPQTTMSLSVTWYNAELRKAQSLKAVLVGELCEAAYDRLDAAAPLTHRQQQYMRIYTAHLLLRIKRVTSELDNHSRIVWPREGTNSLLVEDHTLISRQCMRLLKCEFLLLCRLRLAAYELLKVNAPLSLEQQRSMRRFMINLNRQVLCLQMLNRTKHTRLRKAILEYADADLISALCEIAYNTLRGTVRLTPREKVRLRKYKDKLRMIANRRLSLCGRRREIQQNGGGFLPTLLAPLATTVFPPLQCQLKVSAASKCTVRVLS